MRIVGLLRSMKHNKLQILTRCEVPDIQRIQSQSYDIHVIVVSALLLCNSKLKTNRVPKAAAVRNHLVHDTPILEITPARPQALETGVVCLLCLRYWSS